MIQALLIQSDNSAVIGGTFTLVSGANIITGITRNKIARLTSTGLVDIDFNTSFGSIGNVFAIGQQSDGSLVV